jgi:hypothetical protein
MMYNTKDSKERNEPEKKEACTAAISRAAKKAHPPAIERFFIFSVHMRGRSTIINR